MVPLPGRSAEDASLVRRTGMTPGATVVAGAPFCSAGGAVFAAGAAVTPPGCAVAGCAFGSPGGGAAAAPGG
ncbi:hypothetical protein [Nocardia abscessus]|uniref:hypothetical protein n=1 Tax=Nocardia abscessus TaxID=120957 RepID=UPI0024546519|nr:hypothetical protein [Nocardia abscessus]